ncbi:hypothetical protein J6590_090072 [Homalodisca vitripennis]|nr:hypothetical protein J6590_090072 [Homalodisca vitripennis]
MAGPVYHDCYCGSWKDHCATYATVGHGRTCVPGWPLWVMVGVVYLTTVSHGRIGVLRWPLWVMAGPVYLRSDGERCMGRGTPTDLPLATDDSRPQSNQAVITNL